MNYQLVGRPLVAPTMVPMVAGVPPGAAGVLGATAGGMRPVLGQSLAGPARIPGSLPGAVPGLPGSVPLTAGMMAGMPPPRALLGQPQLGATAAVPRMPGLLPGQLAGVPQFAFQQEEEIKQEEEDAQMQALSQSQVLAQAQQGASPFGLAPPGQPQLLAAQPGAPSPLMQHPAAAQQLQMLQQPGAAQLMAQSPPPLGQSPVVSLSASPVPQSAASGVMPGLMTSLGIPVSQPQLQGLMPHMYGALPSQAAMAYQGMAGMAGVLDPSLMIKEEPQQEEDLGEATKLDTFNSDLNLSIDESGYTAEAKTEPMGFCFCWAGARATYGALSGKVYITENLPVDFGEDHSEKDPHIVRIGWSVDSHNFQLGEVEDSYGYGGTAMFSHAMKFTKYGAKFGKGDVIMALIDLDQREPVISYCKNGTPLGVAAKVKNFQATPSMAMFPHVLSKNSRFEVNFGQKEPWFPPPPGGYVFIDQAPVHTKVRGMLPPADKSECEMIMIVGLPGAGKTTWGLNLQKEKFLKRYNIIGTDTLIDKMRVNGLPRKNNYHGRWDVLISKATNCLNKLFQIASSQPRNYILDQTNVYATARKRKLRNFQGFKKICAVIQPDDGELKRREYKRTYEDGKFVPEEAVKEMKANYVLPSMREPFVDDIMWVELPREQCGPLVQAYNEECKNFKRERSMHRNDDHKRPSYGGSYGAPAEKKHKGGGGGAGSALDFIKQEYDEQQHGAGADQYGQQGWQGKREQSRRGGDSSNYAYQQASAAYQAGGQPSSDNPWGTQSSQQQYTWQQQQQQWQQGGSQQDRGGSERGRDRSDRDRERSWDRDRERRSRDHDDRSRGHDDRRERDYYGREDRDRGWSRDRNDRSESREDRYDRRDGRDSRESRYEQNQQYGSRADQSKDGYHGNSQESESSWQQNDQPQFAYAQNSQADTPTQESYGFQQAGQEDVKPDIAQLSGATAISPELAHLVTQPQLLTQFGQAGAHLGAAGLQAVQTGLGGAAGLQAAGVQGLAGAGLPPGLAPGLPPGLGAGLPAGLQAGIGALNPGLQGAVPGLAGLPGAPGLTTAGLAGLPGQALTAGGQHVLMSGLVRPQLLAQNPLAGLPGQPPLPSALLTSAAQFTQPPPSIAASAASHLADLKASAAQAALSQAGVNQPPPSLLQAGQQEGSSQWSRQQDSRNEKEERRRSPYGAQNDRDYGRSSRDSYSDRNYDRSDSRRSDRSDDRKERRSRWEPSSGDTNDTKLNLSAPPPPPPSSGTPNTGPGILGEAPSLLGGFSKPPADEGDKREKPAQKSVPPLQGSAPEKVAAEVSKPAPDMAPGILGAPPPPPPGGDLPSGQGGHGPRGGMRGGYGGRGGFERGGFRGGFRGRGGFDGPPGFRPPPRGGFRGPPPMGGPPPHGGFRGRGFGGPPRGPPGGFRGGFRGGPRGPPRF